MFERLKIIKYLTQFIAYMKNYHHDDLDFNTRNIFSIYLKLVHSFHYDGDNLEISNDDNDITIKKVQLAHRSRKQNQFNNNNKKEDYNTTREDLHAETSFHKIYF